jgi:hypothetical protein
MNKANQDREEVLNVVPAFIDRSKHKPPILKGMSAAETAEVERVCETMLKPLAFKNQQRQNINPKNTLCVFSNPRGGSTWLGEILLQIPRSVLCNEAIFRLAEFSDLNFTWHQPIPADADWPEARELFRKLLNREVLDYKVYFANDLNSIPGAATHIFKFCHGNMLLDWFTDQFDVLPVLLVRHPCAVVSSQMRHHGWKDVKRGKKMHYNIPGFRYNEVYRLYEDVLNTVRAPEEALAATWCLTMVSSLKNRSNDIKWITLAYENLYTNFDYEIDRVFGRLGLEVPPEAYACNRKLSVSSLSYAEEYVASGRQLHSWKDKLSKKQQHNIMGIVRAFGIDHYSNDPEPDLDKMYVQR